MNDGTSGVGGDAIVASSSQPAHGSTEFLVLRRATLDTSVVELTALLPMDSDITRESV